MEDEGGQWTRVQQKRNKDVKLSFNLDTENYADLIPRIREELAKHKHADHVHDRPLLPERRLGKPARWIRITLVTGGYNTTLFIRDDDVYLIGFETKGRRRYEFGFHRHPVTKNRMDAPLIKESVFLECDVDYRSMLPAGGAMSFTGMVMGMAFARDAVKRLSSYRQAVDGQVDADTRMKLAGLILIICESARMTPHFNRVVDGTAFICTEVRYLWNWANMSRFLIGWTRDAIDRTKLVSIGINTEAEAAAVVHLVRNSRPPMEHDQPRRQQQQQQQPPSSERPDPPGPVDTDQSQRDPSPTKGNGHRQQNTPPMGTGHRQHMSPTTGRPLVEVFTVLANFSLIGTIAVFDDKRGQIIYENSNSSHMQSQDFTDLVLTGPYRAISADDQSFAIRVSESHESEDDDGETLWKDKEAVDPSGPESDESEDDDGEMLWEFKFSADHIDTVIRSRIILHSNKIIKLTHAVLSDAVETAVQVTMTGTTARVHGQITAHSDLFAGESVQLFGRTMEEGVEDPPSSDGLIIPIPLARSVVAAPLRSPLEIKVKLYATCPNHENIVEFDDNLVFSLFEQDNTREISSGDVALVVQVKITETDIYDPPLPEEFDTLVPQSERPTGSCAAEATTPWRHFFGEK